MSAKNQSLFCYGSEKVEGREQRTYTPASITSRLRVYWPEGVALDPCSGPDSTVQAAAECYPEHADHRYRDGLALPWPARTFVNPPFEDLKVWLPRASMCDNVVLLGPVRTRRKWYREALARSSASVHLDPLGFVGHEQDFPADLALITWGGDVGRFLAVFSELGGGHRGPMFNQPSQQALLL